MTRSVLFDIWILISISLVLYTEAGKTPIKINKRSLGGPAGYPVKRTFCNAFTGCGRKRSEGGAPGYPEYEPAANDPMTSGQQPGPQIDDGGFGGQLLDELARDILAESRLWEALQARNYQQRSPQQQLQQGRLAGYYGPAAGRQKRASSIGESTIGENGEQELEQHQQQQEK